SLAATLLLSSPLLPCQGGIKKVSSHWGQPDHCPLCLSVPCRLSNCYFTGVCCGALSAVLSKSQSLRELDMCYNKLGDAGMKLLCDGLRQPDCKLQKLRLTGCGLTPACCEDLSVVITTNQSLTELNINHDALGDSGMKRLHDGLNSASCKLQMLLTHGKKLVGALHPPAAKLPSSPHPTSSSAASFLEHATSLLLHLPPSACCCQTAVASSRREEGGAGTWHARGGGGEEAGLGGDLGKELE
uniref:Uncharacterized protein n=1 Tax=Gopherus agassizii TaxID=38772 RepID=A0A452HSI2_9SAUR